MKGDIDINSFMQVVNGSYDTDEGLEFPGTEMPSGKPLRAAGAKKSDIMTNREMAELWFNSIRSQYAREEEEADHKASVADIPEIVVGGANRGPDQPRTYAEPAQEAHRSLEEELQARHARWLKVVDRADEQIARSTAERDAAYGQLMKVEAALDAVRGA